MKKICLHRYFKLMCSFRKYKVAGEKHIWQHANKHLLIKHCSFEASFWFFKNYIDS